MISDGLVSVQFTDLNSIDFVAEVRENLSIAVVFHHVESTENFIFCKSFFFPFWTDCTTAVVRFMGSSSMKVRGEEVRSTFILWREDYRVFQATSLHSADL